MNGHRNPTLHGWILTRSDHEEWVCHNVITHRQGLKQEAKRAIATHARGARGARRPASRLDGPRSARESVRAPRAIFFATTSVDDAAARGGEIGRNRIERGVTFRRAATASPPRRVAPRPNERRDRARDVFSYDS